MSHDGTDPRTDMEDRVGELEAEVKGLRQLLRATAAMLLAALGEGEEA